MEELRMEELGVHCDFPDTWLDNVDESRLA